MRTTLVIDDDLYRRIKAKAAMEGRRVTDLVEEGLRGLLRGGSPAPRGRRVRLPIIPVGPGRASLFGGMTQQEIHERLDALQSDIPVTPWRYRDVRPWQAHSSADEGAETRASCPSTYVYI